MHELILGGARSGKSRLAQQQALTSGCEVVFIATATPNDTEMVERIHRHRAERPVDWLVVEEAVSLAAALQRHASADRCLLVDCLTLWLANLLDDDAPDEARFARERGALLDTLPRLPGHIILVGNEVGLGVVPLGALTRRFVDEAGRLHQDLARLCQRVTLTVAGLPHILKDQPGDRTP